MIVHYQHKITWFVGVFQVVYLIYWGLIVFSLLISLYIVVFLLLRSGSSSRKKSITPRSIWVYECENCRVSLPKDVLYSCCSEICCRIQQFYCERCYLSPFTCAKVCTLVCFSRRADGHSLWRILLAGSRVRVSRAHITGILHFFAFTTFTQGDCFIIILRRKKQGYKTKNVGDFLENVHPFSEKVQRFWENLPRFCRKVRVFFLWLRICRNSSAESLKSLDSLKSSKFSPIVQTLCAKNGNQYIFTSSSLGGDLSPFKGSFWREFRVWFTTLWNSIYK